MILNGDTIKLGQFLKLVGITPTGGQAKVMIQGVMFWLTTRLKPDEAGN
jgi:ribosome-associated protein YbcJ (S4-like RNA binding protein)